MKITQVDVWLVEGIKYNWTLLRVTTEDGMTGVGEATNWPGSPLVYHAAQHLGERVHVAGFGRRGESLWGNKEDSQGAGP